MHIPGEVSADLVSYINAGLPAAFWMAEQAAICCWRAICRSCLSQAGRQQIY